MLSATGMLLIRLLSLAVQVPHAFHAHALHAKPSSLVLCPLKGFSGIGQFCTPSLPRARGGALWDAAVQEAGLDENKISAFGHVIPKYSAAEVRSLLALDHEKTHRFNFQGSLCRQGQNVDDPSIYKKRRSWVFDFARKNFSSDDVLYIMDRNLCGLNETLGPFDYSDGFPNKVDSGFYQSLAKSQFTLSPGGDLPWSARIWEAIAAQSLPLISSVSDDWVANFQFGECLFDEYHYSTKDNPVYNSTLVELNLQAFIRYQTFMEGDNVPPNCDPKAFVPLREQVGTY